MFLSIPKSVIKVVHAKEKKVLNIYTNLRKNMYGYVKQEFDDVLRNDARQSLDTKRISNLTTCFSENFLSIIFITFFLIKRHIEIHLHAFNNNHTR